MPGPVYIAGSTPLSSSIVSAGGAWYPIALSPPPQSSSVRVPGLWAGPVVREQQEAIDNAGGALQFTASTAQVGDTIEVVCFDNFYTAADLLTPTGTAVTTWTLKHTLDGGTNDNHCKVWEGTVTTAGGTVVTNWNHTDNERYAGMWVFAGSVTVDDVASTDLDTTIASHVAPSVAPDAAQANDLLICVFYANAASNYTPPASMTPYGERDFVGISTVLATSEKIIGTDATGTRTATCTATCTFATLSLLVQLSSASSGVNVDAAVPVSDNVTADANIVAAASAAVSETANVTANANVVAVASSSVATTATVGASIASVHPIDATVAANASVTSTGAGIHPVAAVVGTTATITADATVTPAGPVTIDAAKAITATITAAAAGIHPVQTTQSVTASVAASANAIARSAASVPTVAAIAADATVIPAYVPAYVSLGGPLAGIGAGGSMTGVVVGGPLSGVSVGGPASKSAGSDNAATSNGSVG